MPKIAKRGLLSNLDIREVAICRSGMHPKANVVLYKKRPDPIEKTEGEEDPRSFADHLEEGRTMEIDSALDRRLYALLHTTTEIMRANVSNREALVLQAVEAYAETMGREVPELFSGRLAKILSEFGADVRSSEEDVHAVVKTELGKAGLLPEEPSGGKEMHEFLKSLSERGQAALGFILGDRDPAEFFKGVSEDVGKLVVGLVEKAAETGETIASLEADVEKAQKPAPTDAATIIKGIEDPNLRAYVESLDAAVKKTGGDLLELRKTTRAKELAEIVKGLECLPNEKGALVAVLTKADDGGFLDELKKILAAANEQAKIGKAFSELGIDTISGEGSVGTPDEAHEALVAKAAEIRKAIPSLSPEKAYEKACEEEPLLYQATRNVRTGAVN